MWRQCLVGKPANFVFTALTVWCLSTAVVMCLPLQLLFVVVTLAACQTQASGAAAVDHAGVHSQDSRSALIMGGTHQEACEIHCQVFGRHPASTGSANIAADASELPCVCASVGQDSNSPVYTHSTAAAAAAAVDMSESCRQGENLCKDVCKPSEANFTCAAACS